MGNINLARIGKLEAEPAAGNELRGLIRSGARRPAPRRARNSASRAVSTSAA